MHARRVDKRDKGGLEVYLGERYGEPKDHVAARPWRVTTAKKKLTTDRVLAVRSQDKISIILSAVYKLDFRGLQIDSSNTGAEMDSGTLTLNFGIKDLDQGCSMYEQMRILKLLFNSRVKILFMELVLAIGTDE